MGHALIAFINIIYTSSKPIGYTCYLVCRAGKLNTNMNANKLATRLI